MGQPLGSRYTLGELLGSGAMGQVYRGVDVEGRQFACKVLRSDLFDDPEFITRFLQERSILVNLRGENLVAVHDLVAEGTTAAIVMDFVPGGSLRDLLTRSGTILPAEVARIGAGMANALHAVHLAGFVHRDVKPENVLMDSSTTAYTPKLTDFGISRMTGNSKVGRSTLLAGTPHYVAPEIADGREPTHAADLYSLGIVLYELCCGTTPFASQSVFQVLRSHGELLPGRPEGIPDELWDVIWYLLQKSPETRPRSAEQVSLVLHDLSTRLVNWPVAPRLDKPPQAVAIARGNDNETMLRPPVNTPTPARRSRRTAAVVTVAAVALVGAVGGGLAMASRDNGTGSANGPGTDPVPTSTNVSDGGSGDGSARPAATRTVTSTRAQTISSMPDLVGKKLGEARDSLPKDMKVEILEVVDPDVGDGTVLSTEPEAGQPVDNDSGVTLTVARPAVTVYLDSLDPADGYWSSRGQAVTVGVAGKQYLHSLTSSTESSSCATTLSAVEYNLSKGYRRLVTTAGISDNSAKTAVKLQLEVFADGRLISSTPVGYGTAVPLDLDLTDVLRLRLQWQVTSGSSTCGANQFVLGEAKLLGLAGEIPTSGLPPAATTTTTTTR